MNAKNLVHGLESQGVSVCAVTKGHTVDEVEALLGVMPEIKIVAENRWPDCEATFSAFAGRCQRHFIGHLQSNKVRKIVPQVEVIQSIDSWNLWQKVNTVCIELGQSVDCYLQINVSNDRAKFGLNESDVDDFVQRYCAISKSEISASIIGLMTIGEQTDMEKRLTYYRVLKSLFERYKSVLPLTVLSMGTSVDYQVAVTAGATQVRLGSLLFDRLKAK